MNYGTGRFLSSVFILAALSFTVSNAYAVTWNNKQALKKSIYDGATAKSYCDVHQADDPLSYYRFISDNEIYWLCQYTSEDPCAGTEGVWDYESGQCIAPPKSKEECNSGGQLHMPNDTCTDQCPADYSELGGSCVPNLNSPNDPCTSDSPDYQGDINNTPTCSGQSNCGANETYGLVDGNEVCIPDDYGPPTCEAGTVVLDQHGFVCESPTNAPEQPAPDADGDGVPDSDDSDIDGDGIPDSHDSDVDGDGIPNESDSDFTGSQVDNSDITGRQDELIELSKKQLDATKNLDRKLSNIQDSILSPVDTGLIAAPSFSDTTTRLGSLFTANPVISKFNSIPTIPAVSTCPVYTIGASKFWDSLSIDIHCQILSDHAALLSTLMIAVWSLVGFRIFMSA